MALLGGLVLGAVVERVVIRPVEGAPPLNAVIVTLGLLVLLQAVAGMIWGGNPRSFPPAFSIKGYNVADHTVLFSPVDLFGVLVVAAVMVGLTLLFRRTSLGLRMRASAFAPEVARLLGVRVGRMLTLGWALASMVGSLAGMLVAPSVFVAPNAFDVGPGLRRSPRRCSAGWTVAAGRGGRRRGRRARAVLRVGLRRGERRDARRAGDPRRGADDPAQRPVRAGRGEAGLSRWRRARPR